MALLDSPAATRNRARILRHTLTAYHEGSQIASAAGRVWPIGSESGAFAPVSFVLDLGGARSSHLGILEGQIAVTNGDEVHDGATIYSVLGVTSWEGTTAVALSQVRNG